MLCSSCGTPLPADARFCPNCGTPQSGGDEERRVVTVLFADVVGFTGLAQEMDPEKVKHLMDDTFRKLAWDITSHGGVVDKILGDEIIALFGAPVAHEDDAERAVRAGLQMQQTMKTISDGSEVPIQIRVGINTGEVLVGTSTAGGDYTAMGDVMNLGSRLQSIAEAGQVWVGPDTVAATGDAISYFAAGEITTRGRVGTIEAFVAQMANRSPGERRRRVGEFVGREHEIELLTAQARMAFDQSRAQLALVLGAAGMGKTRVVEEASASIVQMYDAVVLEGRCVPYGEANVWSPVADLMRHGLELGLDDPPELARQTLTDRTAALLPEYDEQLRAGMVESLLHVLGYETVLRGRERLRNRSEILLAVTAILEALLERSAVIISVSDSHWAAEPVWALLDHVMAELTRRPLFVMLTARDSMKPPVPGRHGSLVIQLGPLDSEAGRAMLVHLGVDLDDDSSAELVRRSGGNPFYLEELAALVGSGAEGLTPVHKASKGQLTSLPTTLRGTVAARLDALAPAERSLLEDAAVRGRTGPVIGLQNMAEARGETNFQATLNALVGADLLDVSGSRYQFRSDLVRDVAYGTLTKTVRAQRHYQIAKYLDERYSGNGRVRNTILVAVADHYRWAAVLTAELAGVPGIDMATVTSKALDWLEQAGERALESEPATAEEWFNAGANLATDEPTRAKFIFGRARARTEVHDVAGARSDLVRLESMLDHDPVLAARALLVEGDVDRKAGDLANAAANLRQAAAKLELLDRPADRSLALRLLGITEMFRADEELARQAFEASRAVAVESGDRRNEAWAIQALAWQAFRLGQVAKATELLEPALGVFKELDDNGGLAWTRGLQAWVLFHDGFYDDATAMVDELLPETRRRGDPWAEAVILNLKCSIELWTGQATKAWEFARLAQDAAHKAEDFSLAVQARALEGRALVSRGRIAEGTGALEQAFGLADKAGDEEGRRYAVVSNCASAARAGEAERAIRWAARYDARPGRANVIGSSEIFTSLALALLQRGSVDEAAAQLSLVDMGQDDSTRMYESSVASLVAAAQGDTRLAFERSDAVMAGRSTYLDKMKALIARAASQHQLGQNEECDQTIDDAFEVLRGTDDRLSPLLFGLVVGLLGRASLAEAEQRLRNLGIDPHGWKTALGAVVNPHGMGIKN